MLRLTSLSNQYRRRTLRVLYGQTQGYPYGCTLSTNFDRTSGQLSGGQAVTGSKAAILPGAVALKVRGEEVTLAGSTEGAATDTGTNALRAFGLFANFVGGQLDEIGDRADVGVWRGMGSVYQILQPAFNGTGLPADSAEAGDSAANERYMIAGPDGRLIYDAAAVGNNLGNATTAKKSVARVISNKSANTILIELLV